VLFLFLQKSWFEQYYSRSFVVLHSVTLLLITGEGKKWVWKSFLSLNTFGNQTGFLTVVHQLLNSLVFQASVAVS